MTDCDARSNLLLVLAGSCRDRPQGGGEMRRAFLLRTTASVANVTVLVMEPCSRETVAEMERKFGVVVHCVAEPRPAGWVLSNSVRRWSAAVRRRVRDLESFGQVDFSLVDGVENLRIVRRALNSPIGVDMDDIESVGVLQRLSVESHKQLSIETSSRLAALPLVIRRALIPLRRTPKLMAQSVRMLALWVRLRWAERWALQHCNLVLVASEHDRALLQGWSKAVVVPNGFDLHSPALVPAANGDRRGNVVAFWGQMSYGPNGDGAKWLVHRIVPELRRMGVDATVMIIGRGGSTLGLAPQPGVEVMGFVDDLPELLSCVDVALVPLRMGMGTRIKILEAWANGIPVVSTTIGAHGLDAHHGHDLMIGDDPREFAAAVLAVLSDCALARNLASNGQYRAQNMTWGQSAESLRRALYEEMTGALRPRADGVRTPDDDSATE